MNRTKLIPKLLTITTFGIFILLFSTLVQATATTRPISDFTATNNYVAAWSDPESGLTIFPHGFYIFPGLESIEDCIHSGSVLERDLKDGRILYQIVLHVKGALTFVTSSLGLIFQGTMDYTFQATIIVYEGTLGDPVPNLIVIWFPEFFGIDPIGEGIFSHITGTGTGTFIDDDTAIALGFNPGDSAKVKVNQVGILKSEDHPSYDGESLTMWPVELVFFR